MEIDKKLIESVAKNSNLKLNENEIKSFEKDFKEVLENFSKLQEIDLDCEPSFHPIEIKDKVREDVEKESLSEEEVFENIDHHKDNFIRGPKIV